MTHLHRHTNPARMPESWDYGPPTNHPHDPRNDCTASLCDACDGDGYITDADGISDRCEQCAGCGWLDEDGMPLEIEP